MQQGLNCFIDGVVKFPEIAHPKISLVGITCMLLLDVDTHLFKMSLGMLESACACAGVCVCVCVCVCACVCVQV